MNSLENCQTRYHSNLLMCRTCIDGPDEFEPWKFDCIFFSLKIHFILASISCNLLLQLNPFKPNIPFVGLRKTVQTQIRCHKMRHLIRVPTVYLQNDLYLNKNEKYHQTTVKMKWTGLSEKSGKFHSA